MFWTQQLDQFCLHFLPVQNMELLWYRFAICCYDVTPTLLFHLVLICQCIYCSQFFLQNTSLVVVGQGSYWQLVKYTLTQFKIATWLHIKKKKKVICFYILGVWKNKQTNKKSHQLNQWKHDRKRQFKQHNNFLIINPALHH